MKTDDLVRMSQLLEARQTKLFAYYDALRDAALPERGEMDRFAARLGVEADDELRLALAGRMAALRDDTMVQALKSRGLDDGAIIRAKEEAYGWVATTHLQRHRELLDAVEAEGLFNPYYRVLLRGVHRVGEAMSRWQTSWTAQIIDWVNRELYRAFNGDEEKIIRMLDEQGLFDAGHEGEEADRCYSVLVDEDGSFRSVAYAEAFAEEVAQVVAALEALLEDLAPLEDDLYGQKEPYEAYFCAIIAALRQRDTDKLLEGWAEVDRRWMRVTAPIQVGHPLEYYEDRYRKAVALEWDVRIVDGLAASSQQRQREVAGAFGAVFERLGTQAYRSVYDFSLASLSRVQLYISRPALYYGAEFCGLFSAQVVPNDEKVSQEYGKKIFAFPSQVLASARAKPFLAIAREFFGQEFLDRERTILFRREETWRRIYDISTIGHEYGHILWMERDTESRMNRTGQFKNIEEFKATTGGLVAYLLSGDPSLQEGVMIDLVKRSIGLIAWMETDEVQPYYCEGLIHLHGLFASGVLAYDERLMIDLSRFEAMKEWYLQTYTELARHYCDKRDAGEFLARYARREGEHIRPTDPVVARFVAAYWERYRQIGQQVDPHDSKERWLA